MMVISADMRFEVQDLYDTYAEILDDGPLDQFPKLFTDPCEYILTSRENYDEGLPLAVMRCESRGMLEDRLRSVRELLMYEPRYTRHMINHIRVASVSSDGHEFKVNANYAVLETLHDQFTKILNAGRYMDTIIKGEDGILRFQKKLCIYDSELIPNSIILPV